MTAPTYSQAHGRIIRNRGRASELPCVSCGDLNSRHHWAYQYTAGSEELRDPKGRRYSLNPERDYQPMCTPCHVSFDSRNEERIHEALSASGKKLAAWNRRRRETDPSYDTWLRERGISLSKTVNDRRESDPEYRERLRTARSVGGEKVSERNKEAYLTDPDFRDQKVEVNRGKLVDLKHRRESDPAFDEFYRSVSRANMEKLHSRRVKCVECGKVSSPGGLGKHQKSLGHTGKVEL